jgi:hypothetical protein
MLRHPGETGRSVFVCLAVFLGIIPPSKVDDRNSGEVAEWLTKAPRSGALNVGAQRRRPRRGARGMIAPSRVKAPSNALPAEFDRETELERWPSG